MVRCQSKINYSEKSISCAIVGNNNKRQKRTEFKCKRTEAEMTHSESNDTNIEHFLHRFQADDDSQFQNTRLVHGFFFFFFGQKFKKQNRSAEQTNELTTVGVSRFPVWVSTLSHDAITFLDIFIVYLLILCIVYHEHWFCSIPKYRIHIKIEFLRNRN